MERSCYDRAKRTVYTFRHKCVGLESQQILLGAPAACRGFNLRPYAWRCFKATRKKTLHVGRGLL